MKLFLCAAIIAAMFVGCSRPSAVPVPGGGYQALRQECLALFQDYKKTEKEIWTHEETLPSVIASLRPQYVQVHGSSPPFVDIQTSGGFQHQGLLVICDDAAKDFTPQKGRNWTITKVADFVFEYRE